MRLSILRASQKEKKSSGKTISEYWARRKNEEPFNVFRPCVMLSRNSFLTHGQMVCEHEKTLRVTWRFLYREKKKMVFTLYNFLASFSEVSQKNYSESGCLNISFPRSVREKKRISMKNTGIKNDGENVFIPLTRPDQRILHHFLHRTSFSFSATNEAS